jgi:hypothetical protein
MLSSGTATLSVRIKDNMGGVAVFIIPSPVLVVMDTNLIMDVVESMLINNCSNPIVNTWHAGSTDKVSELATAVGSSLNTITVNYTAGLLPVLNDRVAMREMLVDGLVSLPVSDVSTLKMVSSGLAVVIGRVGENTLNSTVSSTCAYINCQFSLVFLKFLSIQKTLLE